MIGPPRGAARRLARAHALWLATVSPDGAPHLVPLWYLWEGGAFYLCTSPRSAKVRNLTREPRVAVSLENTRHPLICHGVAEVVERPWPKTVVAGFLRKYDWSVADDEIYSQLIRIRPGAWVGG